MPLAILLSYTVLFINLQESKIFNDSVTGLHNRRMADNYIRDSIEDASEKNPLCLLMMDIDDFKSINDRFGHQEGDRTLRITSGCLKKVVTKWNGFLSRWGGDEFMVMLNVGDNDKVGSFMNEVKKELDLAARDESLPYGLGLSMGMEFCRSRDMEPAQLINAADSRLYEVKAARGIEKGEWIRL